jgi:pimeloyl-ACP methyl ester carboxylesterase
MWEHQAGTLADLAEVTIADMTNGSSMGELAGHILDMAPARFALAGLSLGGYVCFEVMRRAPDRVTHLALLDTTARADPPEIIARRHRFVGMAREGRLDEVMASYLPLFVHPRRLEDEPFKAKLAAMSARVGEAAFYRQQEAMLSRPDSRPGLGAICCPTLVLCGRQDALTPLEVHREMVSLIPGSKLVIIEDSGHLTTMEQPQATTAVLRYWLQEQRRH